MSTTTKCQAKNPATCPYHGSPDRVAEATNKIAALFAKKPTFYPAFSKTGHQVGATVVITPNSKRVKNGNVAITVDAASFDELTEKIETKLADMNLKEYGSGYSAQIWVSGSDDGGAVSPKLYASTTRDPFDDESITETGVAGLNQNIVAEFRNHASEHRNFKKAIDEIKDSKIAQSPAGSKAIAVVEAMNTFKYFHVRDGENSYSIESAFRSILDNTREYTNRGWNIRVHMDYNHNGELSNARFSLDDETSKWNSFTKQGVDSMNAKLKKYLDSF